MQDENVVFHVRKSVILYIGGFLSIYAITGDTLFRDKAIEVAEYLLPAFEIGNGFSCTWYHANHGVSARLKFTLLWTINNDFLEFNFLF